jgi:hypothetical protein
MGNNLPFLFLEALGLYAPSNPADKLKGTPLPPALPLSLTKAGLSTPTWAKPVVAGTYEGGVADAGASYAKHKRPTGIMMCGNSGRPGGDLR